jgi:hypothetical protein
VEVTRASIFDEQRKSIVFRNETNRFAVDVPEQQKLSLSSKRINLRQELLQKNREYMNLSQQSQSNRSKSAFQRPIAFGSRKPS